MSTGKISKHFLDFTREKKKKQWNDVTAVKI